MKARCWRGCDAKKRMKRSEEKRREDKLRDCFVVEVAEED
jgi:hypothetical protein